MGDTPRRDSGAWQAVARMLRPAGLFMGRRPVGTDAMRLLFITSTRVGDAVLSTGVLDTFLQSNSGAAVTIVCGRPAAPLFAAVPGLQRIIALDKKPLSLHWLGVWARCAPHLWDAVVDLRNWALSRLIPTRRLWRGGRPDARVHRVEYLARMVGRGEDPPAPRLWITEAHRRRAAAAIADGPPVLAVGPTANWIAKTWPAENFAALVARLTAADGILAAARVAVFGHASERTLAQPLIDAIPAPRCLDLVGRLDLLEVYAALKRCALYIGNDSGLMHIAAAAGIPTLGLFGPSREEHYAPWGPLAGTVRPPVAYEDIFPAGFDHRNTGTLMEGLSVERVEAAATDLWRRAYAAA